MPAATTLREKIGQLLIVGFRGTAPADCAAIERDLREHHIGGVILFDQEMAGGTIDSGPRRRNIESPEQVRTLLRHLQSHAKIPLLTSIDQEGGRVNRLKPAYGFPPSISHQELGALDQPAETYRHATA
ncbi:MAG: glycoside hydrolase family 3, partial [Verrucomicrobia bacterium]|nr:glycoside hydrolase family 3 [Verrucomicrobiota bacterium]